MNIDINKTLSFTGHRPQKLGGFDPFSPQNNAMLLQLREIILEQINNGYDTFITGMALGIDIWSAKIVLALKSKHPDIKLVCAIPCKNHSAKWNDESKREWLKIVNQADYVHYVSEESYTSWCMQKRNEWMVNSSSLVVAVWDNSAGGTGNCVKYARKQEKKIIQLHPKTLEIS